MEEITKNIEVIINTEHGVQVAQMYFLYKYVLLGLAVLGIAALLALLIYAGRKGWLKPPTLPQAPGPQ